VAEGTEPRQKVRRHRDEAALALDRLQHEARDRRRIDVRLEQVLERSEGLVGVDAAIRVRPRHTVDLGREGAEPLLVRHDLARHRHREQRPTVEGVVEDDDGRPTRGAARDLDGVLDRLRAGVDEDTALLASRAGRQLGEAAAHLDVRLVRPDHEALVQVAVDLVVYRSDDRGEAVAGVLAADAPREVHVAATVDVPDPRSLRACDHDRSRDDPAGDVGRPLVQHPLRLRPVVNRHRPLEGMSPAAGTQGPRGPSLGLPIRHRVH